MHFVVALLGTVAVRDANGATPKDAEKLIEQHLDTVMDGLEQAGACDPDIELDLESCEVRLAVLVEAPDPSEAVRTASDILRTAINEAGGATPDWPGTVDRAWSVRMVSLSATPVALSAA